MSNQPIIQDLKRRIQHQSSQDRLDLRKLDPATAGAGDVRNSRTLTSRLTAAEEPETDSGVHSRSGTPEEAPEEAPEPEP